MINSDQLIIIAGPSGVGKSNLLKNIKEGKYPNLSDKLGIVLPSSYICLGAWQLRKVPLKSAETMILHYDFLNNYSQDEFKLIPGLVCNTQKTTIVTLCNSARNILLRRIDSRILRLTYSLIHSPKKESLRKLRTCIRTRIVYSKTTGLRNIYSKWFSFTEQVSADQHILLDNTYSQIGDSRQYNRNIAETFINSIT